MSCVSKHTSRGLVEADLDARTLVLCHSCVSPEDGLAAIQEDWWLEDQKTTFSCLPPLRVHHLALILPHTSHRCGLGSVIMTFSPRPRVARSSAAEPAGHALLNPRRLAHARVNPEIVPSMHNVSSPAFK